MKFFVWLNEQQQGPFDEATIQQMIFKKQITQDAVVRPEGDDLDWTPIKELFSPDFFSPVESDSEMASEKPDDGSRLEIRLSSGAELKIKAVRLYDEAALANVNSQKAEAMELFKGVSTGIGPWGSIGWVLAASAVIGAVESTLSAGAHSSGANLLARAIQAEQELRNQGVFFDVHKIQYVENPTPGFWRASKIGFQKVKEFIHDVNVRTFVHNGDEFIAMMNDNNTVCSVRWNSVESYNFSKPAS